MSAQKCALLVSLVLLASYSTTSAKGKPNNLVVGARVWGDQLLERTPVFQHYAWFRIIEKEVTFPGDGISNITMINLIDQETNGKGATATIINGGPRSNFVTIKFTSQRSNSINFIVEIYGKR